MYIVFFDFCLVIVVDVDLLIGLMCDFYVEDKFDFDLVCVCFVLLVLFEELCNGEVLLWLFEIGEVVGYVVLVMGFSLE